ncbi:hypothetical protein NP493_571g03012 [Ridgeia piscesae]|uniref:Reverse transcriptase domain-containing protein n=1 Tax=Ridgeia piscesae TaxID=27915 RepID=A0AAD9KUT9_RIDPI|nr:hypothetical protein NP493_571g03012 [Ridgeia piscesae]
MLILYSGHEEEGTHHTEGVALMLILYSGHEEEGTHHTEGVALMLILYSGHEEECTHHTEGVALMLILGKKIPGGPLKGGKKAHHTEGVALMLTQEAHDSLISWEAAGPRIIYASYKTKKENIKLNIIRCYAPTNDKELLNQPPPQNPPGIASAEEVLQINCERPSKAEIEKDIHHMKRGKASSPDKIPAEAINADIDTSIEVNLRIVSVKTGVRQGNLLSPFLFLLSLDWIMKKTTENRRNGIQWTRWSQLEDVDFADDLALLSHNHKQKQEITELLNTVST